MGYNEDTHILQQYLPLSKYDDDDIVEKYDIKGLPVKGIAVSNQTNMFGIRWLDQALASYSKSLKGKEIVLNHHFDDVTKVVGKIKDAYFNQGVIEYVGDIDKEDPSKIAHKIEQGYISNTSVRALLKDFRCSICGETIGNCVHRINQTYKGQTCEGLIYDAEAVHLGIVVKGADPNATIGVAQSVSELEQYNSNNYMVLVQSINDSKQKRIMEQQYKEMKIMSENAEKNLIEEYKKQIEELKAFKESIMPTLEQMKKTAQENEKYKEMLEQMAKEKKANLIDQICAITKEEPKTYADKDVKVLEQVYSTVKVLEDKSPKTKTNTLEQNTEIEQSNGRFVTGDAKRTKAEEEREKIITGIGRILNLSWTRNARDEISLKDRNEVAKILTQSAFSDGGSDL